MMLIFNCMVGADFFKIKTVADSFGRIKYFLEFCASFKKELKKRFLYP